MSVDRQREHRLAQPHVGDPFQKVRMKELSVPLGDKYGADGCGNSRGKQNAGPAQAL
ncbi:MAG: hypothetical protein M3466_08880 [Gemmatimonadota bacterium]|nr:hypothetical protein [Gemmatimonadota bacterium]